MKAKNKLFWVAIIIAIVLLILTPFLLLLINKVLHPEPQQLKFCEGRFISEGSVSMTLTEGTDQTYESVQLVFCQTAKEDFLAKDKNVFENNADHSYFEVKLFVLKQNEPVQIDLYTCYYSYYNTYFAKADVDGDGKAEGQFIFRLHSDKGTTCDSITLINGGVLKLSQDTPDCNLPILEEHK